MLRRILTVLLIMQAMRIFPDSRRQVALDYIRTAIRGRRYRAALDRLRTIPGKEDAESRCLRARVLRNMRCYRAALLESARALDCDPGHLPSLKLRALLLQRHRRSAEAFSILRLLVRIRPRDPFTLSQLARVCCALGRYGKALMYCRLLLRQQRDRWGCYRMGVILERLGRFRSSILWYRRALALGFRPRQGAARLLGRISWKGAMVLKRSGDVRPALTIFLRIRRQYRSTFYGKAAEAQIRALRRLLRQETNKR